MWFEERLHRVDDLRGCALNALVVVVVTASEEDSYPGVHHTIQRELHAL